MSTTMAAGALIVWTLVVAAVTTVLAPVRHLPSGRLGSSRPQPPPQIVRPTSRRHRRASDRALDRTYPDALDLLGLSLQSGAMPRTAVRSLVHHQHPGVRAAVAELDRRVERGEGFGEALHAMVQHLGPRALTLVAVLRSGALTGLPLAPMVERLADDAREQRRRQAEAAARELPIRLSFPLVVCTLPSFVLVAVAPVLIGAVSSLRAT